MNSDSKPWEVLKGEKGNNKMRNRDKPIPKNTKVKQVQSIFVIL